jgi:hypothetical protein
LASYRSRSHRYPRWPHGHRFLAHSWQTFQSQDQHRSHLYRCYYRICCSTFHFVSPHPSCRSSSTTL